MPRDEGWHELETRSGATVTEEGQLTTGREDNMSDLEDTWSETDETSLGLDGDDKNEQLKRSTIRKLDYVLLPFLCCLFLLNSIDKSNVGNAETAGTCHSEAQYLHSSSSKTNPIITYRFHARYRSFSRRSQHVACILLRILRSPAACGRRSGPQVWHGSLGACLHECMGDMYPVAHMGSQALAADLIAGAHRHARGGFLSDDC
jgi:hypothetical protein